MKTVSFTFDKAPKYPIKLIATDEIKIKYEICYEGFGPSLSKFKNTLNQENQKYTDKQIAALKKMDLKPNITWLAIKEQFKKLVKKYHPDMNAGDKKYEEKLKEITIAYSYLKTSLSDKQKVA